MPLGTLIKQDEEVRMHEGVGVMGKQLHGRVYFDAEGTSRSHGNVHVTHKLVASEICSMCFPGCCDRSKNTR